MSYEITKGVPLPPTARFGRRGGGKYPFASMLPGDSFFAPVDTTGLSPDEIVKLASHQAKNLYSAAYCWAKDNQPEWKFCSRRSIEPPGARIWRLT